MIEFLSVVVYRLTWLSWLIWIGLVVYEIETANKKIIAVLDKHDSRREFVRHYGLTSRFEKNRFVVDRTHVNCSPTFLEEWNKVYGWHWRKIILLLVSVPIFGFGSQFLQTFLQQYL